MSKGIMLTKLSFDNMENHYPVKETLIGVFTECGDLTPHGNIAEWFKKQSAEYRYLGWDNTVYPVYKLKEIELK